MTAVLERGMTNTTTNTISWAEPEPTLWVASKAEEYAGMVEFRDGRFTASSSTGQPLGEFVSVLRAKAAVEAGPIASARFPYAATVAASAIVSATAVTLTALAVL